MVHAQNTKALIVVTPAAFASTATATAQIDTLGFDYCDVLIALDDDTTAMATMKLTESESSESATSGTDITALVGGGAGGFTMPASVAATKLVRLRVDCRNRMRRIGVVLTPGDASQEMTVLAILSRAHTLPDTAAEAGATVLVNG